jgi:hypothetical protein
MLGSDPIRLQLIRRGFETAAPSNHLVIGPTRLDRTLRRAQRSPRSVLVATAISPLSTAPSNKP